VLIREELTTDKPYKALVKPLKKKSGRNHTGVITCRHKGGGDKKMYRIIDFKRNKDTHPATVSTIEYDPNRNCNIALVEYEDGEKRYILAPQGLKVGQKIYNGPNAEPRLGNCLPIAKIPVGLEVHNIEMKPGEGGKLVRTAGGVARLAAKDGQMAHLILPSGETRMVNANCRATIGQLGNIEYASIRWGKAGRKRHMGIRPTTRGSAMNPHAHPMGGGEGRRSGGRHPVSPWGKLSKGGRTRKHRKNSNKMILRRRRSVRYGQLVL
jgi:large subunit ribosomal protein L2